MLPLLDHQLNTKLHARNTTQKLTSGHTKFLFSSLCTLYWFYSPAPNPQTPDSFQEFLWVPTCRGCCDHEHGSLNGYQLLKHPALASWELVAPQPPSSHAKWHHLHDIQCSGFLIYNLSLSYTVEGNWHTQGFKVEARANVCKPPAPQSTLFKEAMWTLQSNMRGELKTLHCIYSSADCMRDM